MMMNADWVNFELGTDVRDEHRLVQDQQWADAIADGRAHLSHREMAMLNAPQISLAISDYKFIDELLDACLSIEDSNKSILKIITTDILRLIIEYAYPDHGSLITSSTIRRELTTVINTERSYTIANGSSSPSVVDPSHLQQAFPFRVCIRKRPMFQYEVDLGAYDVATVDTQTGITLHEGKLARNGRQLSLTHHQYVVDRVFHEKDTNVEICQDAVEPLLSWAMKGHESTLICFGQTGTGKTYTLYGALDYISTRLMGHSVRMTFYEVHGKRCYDLLKCRAIVHLRSDQHETMHIRGARSVEIMDLHDPDQLMHVLRDALALRSCEVTERNPISSRSHAVCTIELLLHTDYHGSSSSSSSSSSGNGADGADASQLDDYHDHSSARSRSNDNDENHHMSNIDDAIRSIQATTASSTKTIMSLRDYLSTKQHRTSSPSSQRLATALSLTDNRNDIKTTTIGKITLVDLAGSERNYETIQMTSAMHRESADINFSLMALKDCFRAYHMQLVNATQSKVTKIKHSANRDDVSHGHGGPDRDDHQQSLNLFTSATQLSQCIKPSAGKSHGDNRINSSITTDDSSLSTEKAHPHVAGTTAMGRIPFRSSLLTRVLKACFTSGPSHRTTIIATISPTPTDLQHSINTIAHTVLMCPELHRLTHRVTVEVPLFTSSPSSSPTLSSNSSSSSSSGGGEHQYKAIQDWSSKDVLVWIANAERGRFAHVVLPKDLDGKGLMMLSMARLNDLFASSASNKARNQKEGNAWVESVHVDEDKVDQLSKAMWLALRREMQSHLAYQQAVHNRNAR